jgi:hypothetical protein
MNLFYFSNEMCHNDYGKRIMEYVKSATKIFVSKKYILIQFSIELPLWQSKVKA